MEEEQLVEMAKSKAHLLEYYLTTLKPLFETTQLHEIQNTFAKIGYSALEAMRLIEHERSRQYSLKSTTGQWFTQVEKAFKTNGMVKKDIRYEPADYPARPGEKIINRIWLSDSDKEELSRKFEFIAEV